MLRKSGIYFFAISLCMVMFLSSCGINDSVYQESLPYKYTAPQYNLPKDHKFEFNVNFDFTELNSYIENNTFDDFFVIYTDKALTQRAPYYATIDYKQRVNKSIKVIGQCNFMQESILSQESNYDYSNRDEQLEIDFHWQFFETYYLVQKLSKKGDVLEKPLVTAFTIEQELDSPNVNYTITPDGALQFAWAPVEGAEEYKIVEIYRDPAFDHVFANTIATTKETSWNSNQHELERAQEKSSDFYDDYTVEGSLSYMNKAFDHVRFSEDDKTFWASRQDQLGAYEFGGEEDDLFATTTYEYGVIAVAGDRISSAQFIGGERLYAQLPSSMADAIAEEMGFFDSFDSLDTGEQIPSQWPVTMCDGSTQLRGIVLHPENTSTSEWQYFNQETREYLGSRMHLNVPFTIDGTKFESTLSFKEYGDDYVQVLDAINERNSQMKPKIGTMVPQELIPDMQSLDDVNVESGTPNIDYAVNATNPLSEYIGAHLINQSEFIDLSEYVNTYRDTNENKEFSSDDVGDALYEALFQNPMAFGIHGYYFYDDENVLQIKYKQTKDEALSMQRDVKQEADRIVADTITSTMSDLEKARALNDYLINSAEYDNGALAISDNLFPFEEIPNEYAYAWSAYGILVEKKGVCMSYSYAYKVLCDTAGLDCIVVTGIVTESSGGHAWNKVLIDGNWRLVDVTWNDSPWNPNAYFNLSDAELATERAEDSDYIFDVFQRDYMTN